MQSFDLRLANEDIDEELYLSAVIDFRFAEEGVALESWRSRTKGTDNCLDNRG